MERIVGLSGAAFGSFAVSRAYAAAVKPAESTAREQPDVIR